jgi:putative DNA primase/helicase
VTKLDAALAYAARGYYVLACQPGGKVPLTEHGLHDATTDSATIRALWTATPDANIGLACAASRVVVIDVDVPGPEHAQDGRPVLAALEAKLGRLPETVEATTAGGGRHLVFAAPDGAQFVGALGAGVDIRHRAYIVVAPSVRTNGTAYRWIRSPLDQMPAPLPEAWLARMLKPTAPKVATDRPPVARTTSGCTPYARAAVEGELETVRTAPQGDRNRTLNTAALKLGALCAGGECDDVRADLVAAAMAADLPESEARDTVESGWRAGMKTPRTAPAREGKPKTAMAAKTAAPVIDIASASAWADPEPLPDGKCSVPAFDDVMLPAALRPWLSDIAERLQCPPEFGAASSLVALGSVIGRKYVIRPKRCDDWQCISNLWGGVVSPPSGLKSPALAETLKPLRRLSANATAEHTKVIQEFNDGMSIRTAAKTVKQEALKKAIRAGKDPREVLAQYEETDEQEPTERRYIVNDGTTEKIGELAVQNPTGFLIYRDELSGWFASLDRDGHENDRALYLEAWSGDSSYTYDRISRGTIHIPALCLSIFGGIQPGPLAQYLRASLAGGKGHDGLVQRFQVLVYPDPPRGYRNVDRWPDSAARDRAFDTFERLDKLTAAQIGAEAPKFDGLPFLRFAADAQEFADSWRCDLMTRVRAGADHPAVEAHLAKYPSLMPSLALICHLADAACFPCGAVSLAAAKRAATLCAFFEAHARRVYESVAQAGLVAARSLLAKLAAGKVSATFSAHDVYEQGWSGLADRESVEAAAGILVDHGYARELTERTATRPRRRYIAHPTVAQSANQGVPGVPHLRDSQSRTPAPAAHSKASSSSSGGTHD